MPSPTSYLQAPFCGVLVLCVPLAGVQVCPGSTRVVETGHPLQCRWACDSLSLCSLRLQQHPPPPSVTLGALTCFRYLSLTVSLSAINLCSHRNQTGQRALNGVYLILLVQTACTQSSSLLSLIVHEFGCRRVLLGFRSPACCLPPFAIQTSTHEASCEAEAALLSTVSLEAIIPSTCKRTYQLWLE